MLVIADNVFVAAAVEFGQPRHAFADRSQFAKQTLLRDVTVSQAVQAFGERLMNGRGLADALTAGELVGERDGGRVFDVEGHERLQKSTFY